jgi:hypothetical protein
LRLLDKNRPASKEAKDKMSISKKVSIQIYGHSRGMLGKTHSKELRLKISQRLKKAWDNPNSVFHTEEFRTSLRRFLKGSIENFVPFVYFMQRDLSAKFLIA